LTYYIIEQAELLGVDLPPAPSFSSTFRGLILKLGRKSPGGFAVLMDEYDAPLVGFLDRPDLLKDLRKTLRGFYMQLKGMDNIITFLFATGVSRNSHLGLFSAVNHITDLSMEPRCGATLGFTQDELEKRFGPRIEDSARILRMTRTQLLEEMRSYYNGSSFDGETSVYNPCSTLLFTFSDDIIIDDYWFETGTSKSNVDYMKNKGFKVEQFPGKPSAAPSPGRPGLLMRPGPGGSTRPAT
jgi:hypothetical protein